MICILWNIFFTCETQKACWMVNLLHITLKPGIDGTKVAIVLTLFSRAMWYFFYYLVQTVENIITYILVGKVLWQCIVIMFKYKISFSGKQEYFNIQITIAPKLLHNQNTFMVSYVTDSVYPLFYHLSDTFSSLSISTDNPFTTAQFILHHKLTQ